MTQLIAAVAIGTTATIMAFALLLMRAPIASRRPVRALAEHWIAARPLTASAALLGLATIAIASFAQLDQQPATQKASLIEAATDAPAIAALRAYSDKIDAAPQQSTPATQTASTDALPDVDAMIAKLVARLEQKPDDVRGWKMLAWSYLNTGKTSDAVRAYETALKQAPDDAEIKKGLDAARSAATMPESPATKTAAATSAPEQDAMIRSMVDQLAARLETSPNDEDGWIRLMRSRMTLGETSAAKTALNKALATFSSDNDVKGRLTTAAKEMGVE